MKKYYVVCDGKCPGHECRTHEEAADLLKQVRRHSPEAIILSPSDGL